MRYQVKFLRTGWWVGYTVGGRFIRIFDFWYRENAERAAQRWNGRAAA